MRWRGRRGRGAWCGPNWRESRRVLWNRRSRGGFGDEKASSCGAAMRMSLWSAANLEACASVTCESDYLIIGVSVAVHVQLVLDIDAWLLSSEHLLIFKSNSRYQ